LIDACGAISPHCAPFRVPRIVHATKRERMWIAVALSKVKDRRRLLGVSALLAEFSDEWKPKKQLPQKRNRRVSFQFDAQQLGRVELNRLNSNPLGVARIKTRKGVEENSEASMCS